MNDKIFNNPNKIISKLPSELFITTDKNMFIRNCDFNINNHIKNKLIEPVYLNLDKQYIISTFLKIFNNKGKGVFIGISKNKLKYFLLFNNPENILSKNELEIINNLKILIEKILGNKISFHDFSLNLSFFVNFSNYPILSGFSSHDSLGTKSIIYNDSNKYIPTVSFTSSYNHYDIPLPIPKIYSYVKLTKGITFYFSQEFIDKKSGITININNKISELKNHPFYKNHNLNIQIIDGLNFNAKLTSISIIMCEEFIPNYLQFFLNSGTQLILIENKNSYSYFSTLLNNNQEYISWDFDNWKDNLDNLFENKILIKNLELFAEKHINKDSFMDKWAGFLNHLNQNYYNSKYITEPFNNQTQDLNQELVQLDYNKYYDLLQKNYKMIRCWSYRLNPYTTLLNRLKTNHTFVPEFIKLILGLPKLLNLHWISPKETNLNYIKYLIQKIRKYSFNINQYSINNINDLLSINIINNLLSIFFIEFNDTNKQFNLWENSYADNFDMILQFISKQPYGSTFIIKMYNFGSPSMVNIINNIQDKFEKIKIIKNEWFDSYLPYRYLVGINYLKHKNNNKKISELELYDRNFFVSENRELIKIIKYIKSEAQVNLNLFNNYNLINEWIDKWLSNY
jgi:hypothetical protein